MSDETRKIKLERRRIVCSACKALATEVDELRAERERLRRTTVSHRIRDDLMNERDEANAARDRDRARAEKAEADRDRLQSERNGARLEAAALRAVVGKVRDWAERDHPTSDRAGYEGDEKQGLYDDGYAAAAEDARSFFDATPGPCCDAPIVYDEKKGWVWRSTGEPFMDVHENDWCDGIEIAPGEYSGCRCDCPRCEERATTPGPCCDSKARLEAVETWCDRADGARFIDRGIPAGYVPTDRIRAALAATPDPDPSTGEEHKWRGKCPACLRHDLEPHPDDVGAWKCMTCGWATNDPDPSETGGSDE